MPTAVHSPLTSVSRMYRLTPDEGDGVQLTTAPMAVRWEMTGAPGATIWTGRAAGGGWVEAACAGTGPTRIGPSAQAAMRATLRRDIAGALLRKRSTRFGARRRARA